MRGRIITSGPEGRETVAGHTLEGSGGSGARFWTRGFCVEGSSFLVSRAAKPWQGRILEGSGGSGARFWTCGFCVEGSSFLVSRAARPCQGRVLEGSGGSRALLDLWILRGRVVTSGLEAAKAFQGRALEGSGGSGARFWTPAVLRGRVVSFDFEGRETVAGRTCTRTHNVKQRTPLATHTNQPTRTYPYQPPHAYIHLQDCMSDNSSTRAKS